MRQITPRWRVHTTSRHFPTLAFTPERFWFRRLAVARVRAYRASVGHALFSYELEDTKTGKRVQL